MTKKARNLAGTFCSFLKKNFPEVSCDVLELDNKTIEVVAYTPEDNSFEIAEAMAKPTLDILLKGGPHVYVVPIARKEVV